MRFRTFFMAKDCLQFTQCYRFSVNPLFHVQLQNLGVVPVTDLLLTLDVFSVTKNGSHLLFISDINVNQVGDKTELFIYKLFIGSTSCVHFLIILSEIK